MNDRTFYIKNKDIDIIVIREEGSEFIKRISCEWEYNGIDVYVGMDVIEYCLLIAE